MALSSMTITAGSTGITLTGGSSLLFERISSDANGIIVAAASEAYNVRTNIKFRNKKEKLLSDGTWSKAKRQVDAAKPKVLANGSTTFTVARLDLEAHPEVTDAEVVSLLLMLIQCYMDSECANFRTSGSLA